MDNTPSWVKHFDENYRRATKNETELSYKNPECSIAGDSDTHAVSCMRGIRLTSTPLFHGVRNIAKIYVSVVNRIPCIICKRTKI